MSRKRKPQINFQVPECLKMLYDESKASGHWVSRFCAAGLLLMVEDPVVRQAAVNRLRDWEEEYEDATQDEVRKFVQEAELAALEGRGRAKNARARKKRS